MSFPNYQITSTPQQILSSLVKDGSVLITNQDTQNSVWLGHDAGINARAPGTIELPALGTTITNTNTNLWAVAQSGNIVIIVMGPDLSQWVPSPAQITANLVGSTLSQQIATAINNTLIGGTFSSVVASAIQSAGVPPIDLPASVSIVFNQSIAATGTWTSARINVSKYQSLVGTAFSAEQTGGGLGTNPYYRIDFQWSLASDNYDPLVTESYVLSVGPLSFTNNYRHDIQMPCYGDTLTIKVTSYDSKPINFTYGLFGSYRQRSKTVIRGRYPDDFSNESAGLSSDNVLMNANGTVAASANSGNIPINFYEGQVQFSFGSSGIASGTVNFNVYPQPESILSGSTIYQITSSSPSSNQPISYILPRRACILRVYNFSPASINWNANCFAHVEPH